MNSTNLNYQGNLCRTLELATKVEFLSEIKKGGTLRTNGNAVVGLFV